MKSFGLAARRVKNDRQAKGRAVREMPAGSGCTDAVSWHNEIAGSFDVRYRGSGMFRERLSVWDEILRLRLSAHSTVLDLGCGSGIFATLAAKRAARVVAIDGSEQMLNLARESARRQALSNIRFVQGRLEEFAPIVSEPVDLIVCSSVFEYLSDPGSFLQACRDCLKPSGILLISVPDGGNWYRRVEREVFKLSGFPRYYQFVNLVEEEAAMSSRLRSAGFDVSEVRNFSAPPFAGVVRPFVAEARSGTLNLFVAQKTMDGEPAK